MLKNPKLIQLLVSGVMALIFVNIYLKSHEQNISNQYNMVEVLVASRDIAPHKAITPDFLTIRQIPQKFMEPGAILVKEPDAAMARVKGKVTAVPIPAGATILFSNLDDMSSWKTGVAPRLPPGKRGIIMRLGNTDVADLILPGDHVDVIATFTLRQGDQTTKRAVTILQNILVVAVGRNLRDQNSEVTAKSEKSEGLELSLAMDPIEAERFVLAQSESNGEITVTVRAHGDDTILQPAPAAPAPKPAK